MEAFNCPCCSGKRFMECCEPYISGKQAPPTAEALMRSRYTAYAIGEADYLMATTAAKTRRFHKKSDILAWATANHWRKLDILFAADDVVEFNAHYIDETGKAQVHHERSKFVEEGGKWFYLDGE